MRVEGKEDIPKAQHEEELIEAFEAMSDSAQERFLRFTQRLAQKPAGMAISPEQMQVMLDNDTDVPRH